MSVYDKYESVIGLEIHIQLLTKSKAYSSDSTEYGSMPNTNVSVITLGHPGTLPRVNERVIEFAVRLGLACGSNIRQESHYARKNYFYADLPKGYQITQDTTPVCTGGHILIKTKDGKEKKIGITRIHMEEDAGKSLHDQDPFDTLVDLNRAGVPLLEMVSEPEIKSSEEAYAYVTEVRKLVRYLDICDGNMEEGSMRCDANVSVMLKGADKFGRKVEVKNMNSIRNVQRAIEYEIKRQVDMIEKGDQVMQDTRSFDAVSGTTFSMRSKEMANDYRYFPEPDLPPVVISNEYIHNIREKMPALPNELKHKFAVEFGLSAYDADVLTESKEVALYFNALTNVTKNYKAAANWIMGPVKSYLNENAMEMRNFPLKPKHIAELIKMVDDNKVSFTASQKIFRELVNDPNADPNVIAGKLNLIQESDSDTLKTFIEQAIAKFPDKVAEYKNGKTGVVGLFMGEVMKVSKGKADPKQANKLLVEMLDKKVMKKVIKLIRVIKVIRLRYLITLITLITYALSSCNPKADKKAQAEGTISGKLKNAKNITVRLELVREHDDLPLDSTVTDADGKFSLPNKADHLDYYLLRTDPKQVLYLVLKGGENITITGNAADMMNTGEAKGSEENELVSEINSFKKHISDSLSSVYARTRDNDKALADSLLRSIWNPYYVKTLRSFAIEFIAKHPQSVISLTATQFLDKQNDLAIYTALDSSLSAAYPDFLYVQQYHITVEKMKQLPAGSMAPEINLPSPDGKMIALSSLRGKVVLVDFWASWCGPCRQENPHIAELYKEFHSKGFEIYGVSLDDDKNSWKDAITMDHLNWIHVSDLKKWESEVAKKYYIEDIPNSVLIDREGKIIAKGLSGNDLARTIDEALH